jgi:hypothetical protein
MQYKQLLKLLTRDSVLIFLLSGAIGAAIFIFAFGVSVINPTNDAWIRGGVGDMSQHYIGWLFYRQSEWGFPVGLIKDLAYPHGVGITFMDSIPLFAIPFKLFASILPSTFQYFGIWGLISYFLMGGFAALIIKRLTDKNAFAVIASAIFSLSPIVLDRMFSHTALAGHWIVLAGILALISITRQTTAKQFVIRWTVVMILSACIHPYFVPMNAALLVVSTILTHRNSWSRTAIRVGVPLGAMVVVFWAIGGLSVGGSVGAEGLGFYGLNLNSLINPLGYSLFLMNQPGTPGDYEGYAYLGYGVLLLLAIVGYILAQSVDKTTIKRVKSFVKNMPWQWIAITVLTLGLLVAAIGPKIHIGATEIAINLPDKIEKAWSVFRATGRLFWPVYYLIILGIILVVFKHLSKKATYKSLLVFFVAIVLVQGVDILGSAREQARREKFVGNSPITHESAINTDAWNQAMRNKRHIQYIDGVQPESFFDTAYVAVSHHATMSDGYFARAPKAKIAQTADAARKDLLSGNAQRDTLYVSTDPAVNTMVENLPDYRVTRDKDVLLIERR